MAVIVDSLMQYILFFGITVIFTILAVGNPKKGLFGVIAGLCWFVLALAHFALGDPIGMLTTSVAWLFVGLGTIFIVNTVISYSYSLQQKREDEEMMLT